MYEWEEEVKKTELPEGVELKGMYTPSIPWNRVWIYKTDSVDKVLSVFQERDDRIRNTDMVILS